MSLSPTILSEQSTWSLRPSDRCRYDASYIRVHSSKGRPLRLLRMPLALTSSWRFLRRTRIARLGRRSRRTAVRATCWECEKEPCLHGTSSFVSELWAIAERRPEFIESHKERFPRRVSTLGKIRKIVLCTCVRHCRHFETT